MMSVLPSESQARVHGTRHAPAGGGPDIMARSLRLPIGMNRFQKLSLATAGCFLIFGIVVAIVSQAVWEADRSNCSDRMKALVLATINYADQHEGAFPAASVSSMPGR